MRRLDCILEDTKQPVLTAEKELPKGVDDATRYMMLFYYGDTLPFTLFNDSHIENVVGHCIQHTTV